MSESKGVKVTALKTHTFAGKEYHEGDSYVVAGDGVRTTEEYLDTLQAVGFALPAKEKAEPIQRSDHEEDGKPSGRHAPVEPMSTTAESAKDKTALKEEAYAKPVEHRKPHVQTIKK